MTTCQVSKQPLDKFTRQKPKGINRMTENTVILMNIFKFYRLTKLMGLLKMLLIASAAAATPWSIAYVGLPIHLQQFTPWVYWLSLVIMTTGFINMYRRANKEIDATMKPAETLYKAMTHASKDDPEKHKKTLINALRTELEVEEADESKPLSATARHSQINHTLNRLKSVKKMADIVGLQPHTSESKSLLTMATEQGSDIPSVKQCIALLYQQLQASFWLEVEDEEGIHAAVLQSLIDATNQNLGITHIRSTKSAADKLCTVTFNHHNKKRQWSFKEPGHHVAENFLKQALRYIGHHAHGQFTYLDGEDAYVTYLFIPTELADAIKALKKTTPRSIT